LAGKRELSFQINQRRFQEDWTMQSGIGQRQFAGNPDVVGHAKEEPFNPYNKHRVKYKTTHFF